MPDTGHLGSPFFEDRQREIRRCLRIYEGTTEVNKLVIAGQALKAHRERQAR